jgi:hypothetical protein
MPSKEAGARGVQVAVPPLSGHAPHTVEAPGSRRLAPASYPCVSLSLRHLRPSVQALQPPRALGPWGSPVPGLRGRALSWSCPPRRWRPVCWGLWSIWGDTPRASSQEGSSRWSSRPQWRQRGIGDKCTSHGNRPLLLVKYHLYQSNIVLFEQHSSLARPFPDLIIETSVYFY